MPIPVVAAWFAFAMAPPASAIGFTVSPAIVDAEIRPGSSPTVDLRVTNDSAFPLQVSATVHDLEVREGGNLYHPPGTLERTAAVWSSVRPDSRVVPAEATAVIYLHLSPPPAATGTYTGAVFIEGGTGDPPPGSMATVLRGRIVVPLLLRIAGTGTEALSIEEVHLDPPTPSEPLRIRAGVRNDGDVHVMASVAALVMDTEGEVRGRFAGDPVRAMPGQRRALEARWGGLLASGTYDVLVTVSYGSGQAMTTTQRLTIP
ncbi:MAG: hypothetical protein JRI25_15600 [Deltaproteobacteria bacterium]|nr:hypothetical protein [Deltaproteobacteria bacterium]